MVLVENSNTGSSFSYRDRNIDMAFCNLHLASIATPETGVLAENNSLDQAYVQNRFVVFFKLQRSENRSVKLHV